VPESQMDAETRQYRNVVRTWQELKLSKHPLTEKDPAYRFVFQTPKYRWGAHSTAVDSDWIAMLFGPFGDPYRRDSRTPWTGEAYVEINPRDAKELGVKDGDYVWLDADPEDRPYRGAKESDEYFEVAAERGGPKEKLMYPRDPRGSAENTINCRCRHIVWREGYGDFVPRTTTRVEQEIERRG